tara:strand:+ start:534 stop:818 length:285 start_codon:yes stop_codon:yes gene_type:complete
MLYYERYRKILKKAEDEHRWIIIHGAANCIIKAVRRWLALLKIRKSIAAKKQKERKKVTFNEFKKLEKQKKEVVELANDIDSRLDKLRKKLNEP